VLLELLQLAEPLPAAVFGPRRRASRTDRRCRQQDQGLRVRRTAVAECDAPCTSPASPLTPHHAVCRVWRRFEGAGLDIVVAVEIRMLNLDIMWLDEPRCGLRWLGLERGGLFLFEPRRNSFQRRAFCRTPTSIHPSPELSQTTSPGPSPKLFSIEH
jgi:hypothetical protein